MIDLPAPFTSYTYGYPHKSTYRPLTPAVPLAPLWAEERRDALFLYVHIPYCGQRCGFCNLFTLSKPEAGAPDAYLDALERQLRVVAEALNGARFSRLVLGGGTPTYLNPTQLGRLFAMLWTHLGVDPTAIPTGCETSPETATPERLAVLAEHGVDRISMGVQSFSEAENRALGRLQHTETVLAAIASMRAAGFRTINLDFIYGGRGQTDASWDATLARAVDLAIEEIFVYPLYVRALTGLGRSSKSWDDERLNRYRAARARLADAGYEQRSMRFFRRRDHTPFAGPDYRCTEDGMVGLGAGARSYTRTLHYSSDYAVGRSGTKAILADFIARPDAAFAIADYGIRLSPTEQRRRQVLLGLLSHEGLNEAAYRRRFGTAAVADVPQLDALIAAGFAYRNDALRLTAAGLERSDAIGPWLYTDAVRALSDEFELR